MIDKFLKDRRGAAGVSLIIAIFLYLFVASENNALRFQRAANQQFASVNVTETLSNVPVAVGEIDEGQFISGLPESVQVRLTGPRNVINQVIDGNLIVMTEDLKGKSPGNQYIRLVLPDLPSSVDYQITPSQRYVKISTIKSQSLTVGYELDPELVANGLEVKQVTLAPKQVTLTGDEDVINQISRAYIYITRSERVNESFTDKYQIRVVNQQGEVLDVNADITEVEAQVEIGRPSKKVDLTVVPFGENPNRYRYTYQLQEPSQVEIVGNRASLDIIDQLDLVVDVTGITQSGDVNAEIQLPRGVELVEDLNPTIHVEVEPISE